MMKWIGRAMVALSCVFLMWMLVSWYDVVAHNMEPGGTQWEHNAFVLMTKDYEGRQK